MSLWNQPDGVEATENAGPVLDDSSVEIGIDILDKKLGGGIPPGYLVAISAAPESQSEQFLRELTRTRPTLYVTTERSERGVRKTLPEDHQAIVVDFNADPEYVTELAGELPNRSTLVIDHAAPLERACQWGGRERPYSDTIEELRDTLAKRDGVAYLHCLDGATVPPARETTFHLADAVFQFRTNRSGDLIEHSLSIPKFRNGAPDEILTLDMSDGVKVDFSRNIV